jgi:hypothetical protein
LVATGITAVGMDLLLEATKSTLPPGVAALAAIAVGGLVNNKFAGRNALAHEGFLSNTLHAGGLYAGGWLMAGGDDPGTPLKPNSLPRLRRPARSGPRCQILSWKPGEYPPVPMLLHLLGVSRFHQVYSIIQARIHSVFTLSRIR